MKKLKLIILAFTFPLCAHAASRDFELDTVPLAPECDMQKVADQIQARMKEREIIRGAKLISVADTATGGQHKFELLLFNVKAKDKIITGHIAFDSKTCKTGDLIEYFNFVPVKPK